MLAVPFGLGLFLFTAPYFFSNPGFWGILLFSIPMSVFMLSLAYFGLMSQFCWVSVSGEKVTYKGLIKKLEYEWKDIEKTEYPFSLGTTTPYALFHLKSGKKRHVPCGDPEIRKLLSTHIIEKMMSEKLAEQGIPYNSGQSLRD